MEVIYRPVGIIHSAFNNLKDMPIQPTSDASGTGFVEIFPEYVDFLKDLEGFSHIYLLYHFHRVRQTSLMVTPFLDREPRGIFATPRTQSAQSDRSILSRAYANRKQSYLCGSFGRAEQNPATGCQAICARV